MATLFDVVFQTEKRLSPIAGHQARLEARSLVRHVLKIDLTKLITKGDDLFPERLEKELNDFIDRRLAFEPLSKILGVREFYGLDFKVTSDVLDPRPETELLIDKALEFLPDPLKAYHILDCGTGSGCLPITLLKHRTNAKACAIDISDRALMVAQENAALHSVQDRINFFKASIKDIQSIKNENLETKTYDLLISNPPYIPTTEIESLDEDVKNYDPYLALDGGTDGLDFYRALAALTPHVLKPQGIVIIEIGQGQEKDVDAIFQDKLGKSLAWYADLSGIIRCGIWQS